MSQEATSTFVDDELEEGELSIETSSSPLANCHKMQQALDDEESLPSAGGIESSSDDSIDDGLKQLAAPNKRYKHVPRTVMRRVTPASDSPEKRARFKKYSIWTASLQEDSLIENMRGCGVARTGQDRNVENYDFPSKYRFNGEDKCRKRRLSNSTDDLSDSAEMHTTSKRRRSTLDFAVGQRRSVKSRLGHRPKSTFRRQSTSTSGSSDNLSEPRILVDLDDETITGIAMAREISSKLYEPKDDLLLRVVEVLGAAIPIELYKATQRIEADGGMMVLDGSRRRTPGGVFLYLLKNDPRLTPEQHDTIFNYEKKMLTKKLKWKQSHSRDRKVEELKQRLSEQERKIRNEQTALLALTRNITENIGTLSNPPPSPVGDEQCIEYKTHAINHVTETPLKEEQPSTSTSTFDALNPRTKQVISYDEDFLEVNYNDMDFC